MLFTTPEPLSPPQVLSLIHAVQAIDALAEVRVDKTGRQASIEGRLTSRQLVTAITATGIGGVVTPALHDARDSTCCGSCG